MQICFFSWLLAIQWFFPVLSHFPYTTICLLPEMKKKKKKKPGLPVFIQEAYKSLALVQASSVGP